MKVEDDKKRENGEYWYRLFLYKLGLYIYYDKIMFIFKFSTLINVF